MSVPRDLIDTSRLGPARRHQRPNKRIRSPDRFPEPSLAGERPLTRAAERLFKKMRPITILQHLAPMLGAAALAFCPALPASAQKSCL